MSLYGDAVLAAVIKPVYCLINNDNLVTNPNEVVNGSKLTKRKSQGQCEQQFFDVIPLLTGKIVFLEYKIPKLF
jgi:hypothetical protein